MNLEDIKVYRITHIENIPHILQYGITLRNSPHSNPDYITIGDLSLIHTRSGRAVFVDNGDLLNFDNSQIILGDFTPFYFGIKMPMLFVVQNGGNFVQKATSPVDIIYLACSLIEIVRLNERYYFSDGHATDSMTSFYDDTKIQDLPGIIDWEAVKVSFWGGNENLNIKRKKQAEFLVSSDLSPELIMGFGCYSEVSKQKLIDMGVGPEKIKIIPDAYY